MMGNQSFDAGLDGFTVRSRGCKLLGGLYRAAGSGARPTAVLLHGLPGVEKNLDIAYALRDAGWNCAYFHYRGSWGSEGEFTLAGRDDDLQAVVQWLLDQPCVDANRLVLIGQSAGGYLALRAGAADPRIKAIVALCPLVDPREAPLSPPIFDEWASMLNAVSGPQLQAQWAALTPVPTVADRLRDRPLLLLTGAEDSIFPPRHYRPLLSLVPSIEWQEYPRADHAFSTCRRELVERVVTWLINRLGR